MKTSERAASQLVDSAVLKRLLISSCTDHCLLFVSLGVLAPTACTYHGRFKQWSRPKMGVHRFKWQLLTKRTQLWLAFTVDLQYVGHNSSNYRKSLTVCGDLDIFAIVWRHHRTCCHDTTLAESRQSTALVLVDWYEFHSEPNVQKLHAAQNQNIPIYSLKTNSLLSVSALSFSHKVAHPICGITLIPDRVYCIPVGVRI